MKKIAFSDKYGLTDAVIQGRKTMTRRIIPINLYNQTDWKAVEEGDYEAVVDGDGYYHNIKCCGRYRTGEEVAVSQSYKQCWSIYQKQWESYNDPSNWRTPDAILGDSVQETAGWTNKMFVRANLMPHRIIITGIKVEHLQDISEEDCMKEGLLAGEQEPRMYGFRLPKGTVISFLTPRETFAALINRICGRGTWERNPWVFAYSFTLKHE